MPDTSVPFVVGGVALTAGSDVHATAITARTAETATRRRSMSDLAGTHLPLRGTLR